MTTEEKISHPKVVVDLTAALRKWIHHCENKVQVPSVERIKGFITGFLYQSLDNDIYDFVLIETDSEDRVDVAVSLEKDGPFFYTPFYLSKKPE